MSKEPESRRIERLHFESRGEEAVREGIVNRPKSDDLPLDVLKDVVPVAFPERLTGFAHGFEGMETDQRLVAQYRSSTYEEDSQLNLD